MHEVLMPKFGEEYKDAIVVDREEILTLRPGQRATIVPKENELGDVASSTVPLN